MATGALIASASHRAAEVQLEEPAPVQAPIPVAMQGEGSAEVRPEARPVRTARPKRKKPVRRPVAQTRQMATELRADGASNAQVAQQLGISERRLRQVLQVLQGAQ
jgi:hypothetical protein